VERYGRSSVTGLIEGYRAAGREPCGAGLVVGSDGDPDAIANPHIRAHALEGRLFRRVVEEAALRAGLACAIVLEREAYAVTAREVGGSEERLRRAVAELGRGAGGRWRAEEKTAAAAAWLVLARRAKTAGRRESARPRRASEPARGPGAAPAGRKGRNG